MGAGGGGAWQEYDTLLSVAAMARTTVRSILELNRDLDARAGGPGLAIGQELCLLLCSPPPPAAADAAATT